MQNTVLPEQWWTRPELTGLNRLPARGTLYPNRAVTAGLDESPPATDGVVHRAGWATVVVTGLSE